MNKLLLSEREDSSPLTSSTAPHKQLSQNGSLEIYNKLVLWVSTMNFVEIKPSVISKLRSQGLFLSNDIKSINPRAVIAREFAHIHPYPDGSLHLFLPMTDAKEVVQKGWGEFHPLAFSKQIPSNFIMFYCPRTEDELAMVKEMILRSYSYAVTIANGTSTSPVNV